MINRYIQQVPMTVTDAGDHVEKLKRSSPTLNAF